MLSKEFFVRIMEKVKALHEYQDKICEVFDLNDWPIDALACDIADIVAKELKDDNDDYGPLILSYIYDYNYGTSYGDDKFLIESDGVEYKPKSFEELYDCLIKIYW